MGAALVINEVKGIQIAIDQIKGYLYPTESEQAAAYELLIELSTRAAGVQATVSDSTVRDTLSSIHQMFDLTRGILRAHGADASKGSGGNLSLAVVAVRVLNEVFRPTLSKWHPILCEYEARREQEAPFASDAEWERRWPEATKCRAELAEMRGSIRAYIDTLSRIAGAPAVADAVLHAPSSMIFAQQKVEDGLEQRGAGSGPPRRSKWFSFREPLPYRKKMVRWLDLVEMAKTFGAGFRSDRSLFPDGHPTPDESLEPTDVFTARPGVDFWFDYIADIGDGFDGSAPVAWLAGRQSISIPDDRSGEMPSPPAHMPRGQLLVFGGDEVYPYATARAYQEQTVLPYAMGFERSPAAAIDPVAPAPVAPPVDGPTPETEVSDPGATVGTEGDDPGPTVVAIPGNHDWLGGIEHFERLFTKQLDDPDRTFAEHWKVVQSRRYWHVKLPQGWWLWGIDTGLDNEWPDEQVEYFKQAAEDLDFGDRVVLCTPVPLWQMRQKHPKQYTRLRSKLDPLIAAKQARLPLCLSGDTHVFAHFERLDVEPAEDHITAGGGGAFLQPTHNLPERIPLEHGNAEFKMTSRWPLPADSRALAAGVRVMLDVRNWPLAVLVGLLHAGFLTLLGLGRPKWWGASQPDRWNEGAALRWALGSPWGWPLLLLVVGAGVVSVKGNSLEPRLTAGARVYGLLTGIAMAASMVFTAAVLRYFDPWPRGKPLEATGAPEPISWFWIIGAVVGGGVLTLAVFVGMSRWVNSRIKASDTVAFSPGPSTRFKHFLRCRIDQNGDLTVYVVGIDPVGKGWYKAMTEDRIVPPYDPEGIPRIHYVWGRTYRKFVPHPIQIAISISGGKLNDDAPHPADVFFEAASHLIRGGHTVMYGGRPVEIEPQDGSPASMSYTTALRQIELERHRDNPNLKHHLINYVAAYLAGDRPAEHSYEGRDAEPADRLMDTIVVEREPDPAEPEGDYERQIRDLTAMRHRMTKDADVRLVIGGALWPTAFRSRIAPGVIEEAYIALQARQPLIILGGFGGAGELLAKALNDDLDPAELDRLAECHLTPPRSADGAPGAGLVEMVRSFNSLGLLRNGLTDGQNRELLRTRDVRTATGLIWRSVDLIGSHYNG